MVLKEKVQILAIGIAVVTVTSFVTVFALKSGSGSNSLFASSGNLASDIGGTTVAKAESDLDTDKDGLDNKTEIEMKLDPWSADTDGDRLSDGREVNVYDTDPLVKDTDSDGYEDGIEVANGHDPNDPDPDALLDEEVMAAEGSALNDILTSIEKGEDIDLSQLGELKIDENSIRSLGTQLGADPSAIESFELPEVRDSDIKVGEENNQEANQRYFDELQNVLYKECTFCDMDGGNEIVSRLESGDLSSFDEYAEDLADIADGLLDLEATPATVDLHKEGVALGLSGAESLYDIASGGLSRADDGGLGAAIKFKGLLSSFQSILSQVDSLTTMYNISGIPNIDPGLYSGMGSEATIGDSINLGLENSDE